MSALDRVTSFAGGKQALSLLGEFKKFAFKGNVIDLAVAVVIGGAFTKIVDAFVKRILMPMISLVLPGEQGYKSWQLGGIQIGEFLAEVINFLLVAAALFIVVVKLLGWLTRKREESPPPAPTKDQELLTEIRDLLKAR